MGKERFDYFKDKESFVKKTIVPLGDNVYEIRCLNYCIADYFSLCIVASEVNLLSVKAKQDFVEAGKTLTEDDLFLVRTMDQLPDNLIYQSFTKRGLYSTMRNPFDSYLRSKVSVKDEEQGKIVCPIYRDTIHFAMNGIVSNNWYSSTFTNRGVVVVEPFKSHKAKAKNINPVDLFIDVGKEDEPISEQAIIIMDKSLYQSLEQVMKALIKRHKLYLFDSNDYIPPKDGTKSPLEMITDIALWNEGYLPLHSAAQSCMSVESVSVNGQTYTDKEYLKMFTDLIDKLSMEMFGVSYYHLNDEIKNNRKSDNNLPGVTHWDTPYFNQEAMMNNQLRKATIKRYLLYLHDTIELPDEVCEQIAQLYCRYIDYNFSLESYGARGHLYSKLMTEESRLFIQNIPIQNLLDATTNFNQMELSLIREYAKKFDLNQMISEHFSSALEEGSQKK